MLDRMRINGKHEIADFNGSSMCWRTGLDVGDNECAM